MCHLSSQHVLRFSIKHTSGNVKINHSPPQKGGPLGIEGPWPRENSFGRAETQFQVLGSAMFHEARKGRLEEGAIAYEPQGLIKGLGLFRDSPLPLFP